MNTKMMMTMMIMINMTMVIISLFCFSSAPGFSSTMSDLRVKPHVSPPWLETNNASQTWRLKRANEQDHNLVITISIFMELTSGN